jgi:hypothetical protein
MELHNEMYEQYENGDSHLVSDIITGKQDAPTNITLKQDFRLFIFVEI